MKRVIYLIIKDILCLLLIFGSVWYLTSAVIINGMVPTKSMEPLLPANARFIGDRMAYDLRDPERFDVIVFKAPDTGELYVKRVIGLPGDIVKINNDGVFINNSEEPLEEDYLKEEMLSQVEMTFEVPGDSYFVLGDNRNNSHDSRYWENHYVARDAILGKAIVMISPNFRWLNKEYEERYGSK